jgi:hypothetical protein
MVILPKPVPADLASMHRGQVLFGWAHCVQQADMTQLAIDRQLTVIAWEAMNHWSPAGDKILHVFYKNNEIAGYAAVLHGLELLGIDGHYGPRRRVTVFGYGSSGQDGLDMFAIAEQMSARGWFVSTMSEPPGIHMGMPTLAHVGIVDEYLADLAASAATVRDAKLTSAKREVTYGG